MTAALPNRIPNDSLRYRGADPRERLIVALDVSSTAAAQKIVAAVGDSALTYKVGMHLYTAVGPQVVRDLVASGRRVFLDLKYHDIPNTVGAAVSEAEKLGVSMLTVHAAGSGKMLRAAVEAAKVPPEEAFAEVAPQLQEVRDTLGRLEADIDKDALKAENAAGELKTRASDLTTSYRQAQAKWMAEHRQSKGRKGLAARRK